MDDASQLAQPSTLYCATHATVETLLRCSKCGKPICQRCGIRTPVGLRCRECAQMRRPPSYVLGPLHYLVAVVVGLPAATVAGLIMAQMGFYLAFFLGAGAGGLIAEMVYRATRGKRGPALAAVVAGCIIVGALASSVILSVGFGRVPFAALLNWPFLLELLLRSNVVYVVLAVGAVFARLR